MQRRSLVKILGAGLLQAAARLVLPFRARSAGRRRLRPSDVGWPAAARWEELNQVVGGNLIRPRPLFAPCQAGQDQAACADVANNIRNPFYIGDQPAGTQVSGWLDAWSPSPSEYAIRARNTADVVAGVNFARENNLRLVIKGGGHSYLGTSNAPDSLLIWTRAMNKVTLYDHFVPEGCAGKLAPLPAVTAEAGAMWIDLYDSVTTAAGRYVQGGGCTSVGVAGLVQSGGFGSFSKGFGTAAAGLLEAEVVTADGKVRIANACSNPDLFWAIKGGGGGTWGVVTRLTLRTHQLPEFFGWAEGKIKAKSDGAFRQLIRHFVTFYKENLFNSHWGEQIRVDQANTLELSMVCQGLDNDQVTRVWRPFFNAVKSSADLIVTDLNAGANAARHWWDVVYRKSNGSDSMVADPRPGAPASHAWWSGDAAQVGAFLHGFDSLWLPASLLDEKRQESLSESLFAASRQKRIELHFNKGIAGATPEAVAATRNTATNPAVTEAFALVIIADGEVAAYPGQARPPLDASAGHRNAHHIDLAVAELRRIAPNPGSYVSESNFFNSSWQEAYWGTNYAKLQAIKAKYDCDGLFFVHHGVGSEQWSADGFLPV
ncbi:MAG: FAD-binding protein [Acidobacteria bacterium]|nr:FAD-binding protein [Acidobacteriota bacterium]